MPSKKNQSVTASSSAESGILSASSSMSNVSSKHRVGGRNVKVKNVNKNSTVNVDVEPTSSEAVNTNNHDDLFANSIKNGVSSQPSGVLSVSTDPVAPLVKKPRSVKPRSIPAKTQAPKIANVVPASTAKPVPKVTYASKVANGAKVMQSNRAGTSLTPTVVSKGSLKNTASSVHSAPLAQSSVVATTSSAPKVANTANVLPGNNTNIVPMVTYASKVANGIAVNTLSQASASFTAISVPVTPIIATVVNCVPSFQFCPVPTTTYASKVVNTTNVIQSSTAGTVLTTTLPNKVALSANVASLPKPKGIQSNGSLNKAKRSFQSIATENVEPTKIVSKDSSKLGCFPYRKNDEKNTNTANSTAVEPGLTYPQNKNVNTSQTSNLNDSKKRVSQSLIRLICSSPERSLSNTSSSHLVPLKYNVNESCYNIVRGSVVTTCNRKNCHSAVLPRLLKARSFRLHTIVNPGDIYHNNSVFPAGSITTTSNLNTNKEGPSRKRQRTGDLVPIATDKDTPFPCFEEFTIPIMMPIVLPYVIDLGRVFATVNGRLSTAQSQKYEITVGEICRRLHGPEVYSISLLSSLIRRAKIPNNTQILRDEVLATGIPHDSNHRRGDPISLFGALSEAEGLHLGKDFSSIVKNHFPIETLANVVAKKFTGSKAENIENFSSALNILNEVFAVLDLDASPIGPEYPFVTLADELQLGFSRFSMFSHCFGMIAVRSVLEMFRDFLINLIDEMSV